MKRYMRFGELPVNGKSVNFRKMNFEKQDDFLFFLRYDAKEAYDMVEERCPECLESGVSVFDVDENDRPILANDELRRSYERRIYQKESCYIVTGVEVGRGQDGEPLLKDVEIVETLKAESEKIEDEKPMTAADLFESLTEEQKKDIIEVNGKRYIRAIYEFNHK